MIDVQSVLQDVPHFEAFCSVEKLHALVAQLSNDSRFCVEVAGTSRNGMPIHHVRFGAGRVKALFVAFPHCMEPIGGLTVYSLLTALKRGNRTLVGSDVEWHIVPCIDPDGAMLNEGWTQKPFSFPNYMRNYYVEECESQVDMSFPISYKKMLWDRPSREAQVLQGVLDRVLPDFYFSLHNTRVGGAFYYISRDLEGEYYQQIYRLLDQQGVPLQKRAQWKEVLTQFGEGILETVNHRKFYDYFERIMPEPEAEDLLQYGQSSWEYLAQIKPPALSFIAEMGYVLHPDTESERDTGQNLRRFKLRMDAENKFLATVLLDQWAKVKNDLDPESPFFRTVVGGWVLPDKDRLSEGGLPVSRFPTRDLLFNPEYDRPMTEGDRFNACMVDGGFFYHLFSYQLVRLLRTSTQTAAVRSATERLEEAFDDAHAELARHVNFGAFVTIECDRLARTQLGSGLIALNSVLEAQGGWRTRGPG